MAQDPKSEGNSIHFRERIEFRSGKPEREGNETHATRRRAEDQINPVLKVDSPTKDNN